jgi:poly-gamma-glutamate capsule biosynthesis protein CapA/YwtB (metallophosphatase superfamily)
LSPVSLPVYAPFATMSRIILLCMALSAGAPSARCASLLVLAPDDLWPEWLHVVAASPLPAGVDAARLFPGRDAPGDSVVLSLGGAGKVVGFMPVAPVTTLGSPRRSATRVEVEQGIVQTRPLCDITLPEIGLPLDGVFPGQAEYPLQKEVTLQLRSANAGLRAWYERLPDAGGRPGASIAWIEAVGDIMPARGVDNALLERDGLDRVFGNVLTLLRGSNLLLGNLESSAALTGKAQDKSYTFRFRGEAVGRLKDAGFSYLSLANNHTFDFGMEGFLQTLAALSRWGVATSGAGADLAEASRPFIFHVGGQEIRVLSFGAFPVDRTGFDGRTEERARGSRPGILWLDEQGFEIAARAFSGRDSFNIAFVHGGEEWRESPTAAQKRLYRELVRSGANLVIGAHPHVLEGMEALDGNLIAYSLGNFLFPGMDGTPGGEDSVILRLGVFDGKVRYVEAFPVRLRGRTVRRATDDHAWNVLMARTRALAD